MKNKSRSGRRPSGNKLKLRRVVQSEANVAVFAKAIGIAYALHAASRPNSRIRHSITKSYLACGANSDGRKALVRQAHAVFFDRVRVGNERVGCSTYRVRRAVEPSTVVRAMAMRVVDANSKFTDQGVQFIRTRGTTVVRYEYSFDVPKEVALGIERIINDGPQGSRS